VRSEPIASAAAPAAPIVSQARSDSWLMATPLAVAIFALGFAIQLNNGALTPTALFLVTVAFAGLAVAVMSPTAQWLEALCDRPAVFVLGVGLAVDLGTILTSPAGVYLRGGADAYDSHHFAIALSAILAGAGLSTRPWLGPFRVPLLLGAYFFLGVWLIKGS